jgi:hypothetical protein
MSCSKMQGSRTLSQAGSALRSLMRDYDAEAWIPDEDKGARLYGHYPDGRQYTIRVTRLQIEARGRVLANDESEVAHDERS